MRRNSTEKYEICVENSAPSQKIPAKSLAMAAEFIDHKNIKSIADYGFGRLRNLKILQAISDDLTLVDVPSQIDRMFDAIPNPLKRKTYSPEKFFKLKRKYDLITCIAVLHIVPEAKLRSYILKGLRSKLSNRGVLLVDIPRQESYYADASKFPRYKDGILLGKGAKKTFRKNFNADDVDALILSVFPSDNVEVVSGCGGHVRLCWA